MGEGERENSAVLTPMGRREHSARRPRWDLRPLIAAVAAVAAVAALVSSWHFASPGVSDLLGTRLSGTQSRWQEEARAAQAAARARKAQTLDLRFRRLTLQSRIARKTAQLAARRAQRQTPLAKEVAQEFDAWTTSWHRTHPGASLAEERVAWHAREGELGRIAAWVARQRRRVATLQAACVRVNTTHTRCVWVCTLHTHGSGGHDLGCRPSVCVCVCVCMCVCVCVFVSMCVYTIRTRK